MHFSGDKQGRRGSARIERTVAGVHIRRLSGTADPDIYTKIEQMLDEIDEAGRDDLARMIADGHIKAVVLLNSFRRQGLSLKLSPERALPLKSATEAWLKKAEAKRKRDPDEGLDPVTCRGYRYALGPLLKAKPTATIADLPALLANYRTWSKGARQFNITRSACQAFIRDNTADGRYSELWAKVSRVEVRTVRRKKTSGLPPDLARTVAERLGVYGAMWWTLCCTGMGRKEYWETPWSVEADRIKIHGTKREHRDRVVPRICTPIRPLCQARAFEKALWRVAGELNLKRLTTYDGRRTWKHFLELANIPPSRQDSYMGHAPGTKAESTGASKVGGLYAQHEVEPYLAADAERLREVAGPDFVALKVLA